MSIKIKEIVTATAGQLLAGNGEAIVEGFSIDSRTIRKNDFFVPLPGEQTDGHNYIFDALNKGASGTFVANKKKAAVYLSEGKAFILVQDVLKALQKTAAYYRKKFSVPIVAVTGSAGKTTTKDMIESVLETKYSTLKTVGNLNNHIGVPLTLLRLKDHHQVVVLEMGMSGFGEIAFLARMAKPEVGVITNIGEAHLEMVGSLEGVARAKGELLLEMGLAGRAVLNGEDQRLVALGDSFSGTTVYYGFQKEYCPRAENLLFRQKKTQFELVFSRSKTRVLLPLPGKHNVLNALAAAAVGDIFKLSQTEIKQGLERVKITAARLEVEQRGSLMIINDTYNANPTSVRASLEALTGMAGKARCGVILGDMLELGIESTRAHYSMGKFAALQGVDYLITLGTLSRDIAEGARRAGLSTVVECKKITEVLTALENLAAPGDWVLVKGSRSMKMEKIIDNIL